MKPMKPFVFHDIFLIISLSSFTFRLHWVQRCEGDSGEHDWLISGRHEALLQICWWSLFALCLDAFSHFSCYGCKRRNKKYDYMKEEELNNNTYFSDKHIDTLHLLGSIGLFVGHILESVPIHVELALKNIKSFDCLEVRALRSPCLVHISYYDKALLRLKRDKEL